MKNKPTKIGPMNNTPAKAALLEKWQEAKNRQWELSQQGTTSGHEYSAACSAMDALFALGVGLGNAKEYPTWVDAGPDNYPWVQWEKQALDRGVDPDVADTGKDVYRLSLLNFWVPEIKSECGWDDNGEAMIVAALDDPDACHTRWNLLISSNGLKDTLGNVSPDPL